MKNPPAMPEEALFRVLLGTPRPTWRVTSGILGGLTFDVSGLTAVEFADILGGDAVPDLKDLAVKTAVCHYAIREAGKPVFAYEQLDKLYTEELEGLFGAVMKGLAICSPGYLVSDIPAWERVLIQGAKKGANRGIGYVLAECTETHQELNKSKKVRYVTKEYPERYFGLPLNQLTDGHWMAYRAARKAFQHE